MTDEPPTLQRVLDVLTEGFGQLDHRFEHIDQRFEALGGNAA